MQCRPSRIPVVQVDVDVLRMLAEHRSVDDRRQQVVTEVRPRSDDTQLHCVARPSDPLGRLPLRLQRVPAK